MPYPDEPDHDDRDRDDRGADRRRRPSRPARPAWDAATYGTPEDLRRTIRDRGRGYEEPTYPEPTYEEPPSRHEASRYEAPRYDEPRYEESRYEESRYEESRYDESRYEAPREEPRRRDTWFGEPPPAAPPREPDRYAYTPDPYTTEASPRSVDAYPAAADSYPAAYSSPDPYAATLDPFPFPSPPSSYAASPDAYPAAAPDPYPDPYPSPDPYASSDPYAALGSLGSFASTESFAATDPDPDQYPRNNGRGLDAYPGGADGADLEPEPPQGSRAGRNLPAAIGVGVGLGAVVAASLFLWRPAFFAVIAFAVGVGIWEMVRAVRSTGVNPPLIPLIAGGALMTGLAWWGQADALTFGLVVTVLAAMVWRLADGAGGYGRDVTAAVLIAVYVPFLAGFAALLATPTDGDLRVVVTLAGVVLSDTGGYIAGVLMGRHPMAPSVSPKKSWEGLAGSMIAAAIGGAIMLALAFDLSPLLGALFGLAIAAVSVLGDLGESMIKRDLGVKDMSNLLPGHGGLMDRLDSIIFAAPTGYVLLLLMAPPG